MADIYAFYDMTAREIDGGTVGALRLDISAYAGRGKNGAEDVVFIGPERVVTESETMNVSGVYQAYEFHDGKRGFVVPIGIVGATWQAAAVVWESIRAELSDFPAAFRVKLDGATADYYYELLPSSTWEVDYTKSDHKRGPWICGRLILETQPNPIGQTTPKTFA